MQAQPSRKSGSNGEAAAIAGKTGANRDGRSIERAAHGMIPARLPARTREAFEPLARAPSPVSPAGGASAGTRAAAARPAMG